jgi:hypothetical protein
VAGNPTVNSKKEKKKEKKKKRKEKKKEKKERKVIVLASIIQCACQWGGMFQKRVTKDEKERASTFNDQRPTTLWILDGRRGPLYHHFSTQGSGSFKEEWNSRVSVHIRSSQTIHDFPQNRWRYTSEEKKKGSRMKSVCGNRGSYVLSLHPSQ